MQTLMKIDYNNHVITADKEHESALRTFISAIATGSVKIETIKTCWPDESLFVDVNDQDRYPHTYEELINSKPTFESFAGLKQKTKFLEKLEKKNAA